MTPEGKIKALINKGIKQLKVKYPGVIFDRMPVSRGMGRPWLDYVLCVNGLYCMIEAKRDLNHLPTEQQVRTINEGLAAGAFVFIVYDKETLTNALWWIEHNAKNPCFFSKPGCGYPKYGRNPFAISRCENPS